MPRFLTVWVPPTTVGYNTQTLTAGDYNLISLPFAGVDGGSAKLADVMSGANWKGGETFNDGDQIQLWGFNDKGIGGYTIYYADAGDPTWDGWYDASGSYYFEEVPETDNANGLKAGEAFWYLSRAPFGTNHTIKFYNPTK